MNTQTQIQALDYFEKFRCIGSACESTCCNSWKIIVDQESRKKYQKLNEENGEQFFQHIVDDGKNTIIALKEDGICPYLSQDNLCNMIARHGHDILCNTCKVYPRMGRVGSHGPTIFASLALSCPQAARLAILRPKKLKFLNIPPHNFSVSIEHRLASDGKNLQHNQILEAIHAGFCEIIQTRAVSFAQRMTALLLLSSLGSKLNCLSLQGDAQLLFQETEIILTTGFSSVPELAPNIANQFHLFVEFIEGIVSFKKTSLESPGRRKLFEIVDRSFSGLEINSFRDITAHHFDLYRHFQLQLLKPYLAAKPYILENIVAHHILSTNFPFNKNLPPLQNFIFLAVMLLIILGLLVGYAGKKGSVEDQDVIRILHTVFREIDHNPQSSQYINQFVQRFGADSPGHLFTLFAL